jgi:hypothetical protein
VFLEKLELFPVRQAAPLMLVVQLRLVADRRALQ